MKKNTIALSHLLILLSLSACSKRPLIKKKVSIINRAPTQNTDAQQNSKQPPPITIWVHGTRLLRRPIFRQVFESTPQIKPAQEIAQEHHLRMVADTLALYDPVMFPIETSYIFGWSGKLDTKERADAAQALYQGLIALIDDYQKKYNTYPPINILSHSHGGNIALNMPSMAHRGDPPVIIEKLVLLACPVQINTMHAINDPMFKQTYAMYSSLDMIQIIAPQYLLKEKFRRRKKRGKGKSPYSNMPSFSCRRFPMSENLRQIKIKINGRAMLHTEFNNEEFLTLIPRVLTIIDTWYENDENNGISPLTHEKLLSIYTAPKPRVKRKKN
jgi:hypothetical protein